MPIRIVGFVILSLVAVLWRQCPPKAPKPPTPSLAWVGAKTYSPAGTVVTVAGLGISAPVDVLPEGTGVVTVSRSLANVGQTSVGFGYSVEDKVERLTFIASGPRTGFIPGGTVRDVKQGGPALAPGASAPITFGPIVLPGCGFYRETLTAPGIQSVHYFAVSSPMRLSVISQPLGVLPVEFSHDVAGKVAFTVTFTPGPNTTFNVIGPNKHPVIGSEGSRGTLAPAPNAGSIAAGVTVPQVVTYSITGRTHSNAPCTDILTERLVESVNSVVSAITSDRCVLQQAPLPVNVIHPCR